MFVKAILKIKGFYSLRLQSHWDIPTRKISNRAFFLESVL